MKKVVMFVLMAIMALICAAPALAANGLAATTKEPSLSLKVIVEDNNINSLNDRRNVTYIASLSNVSLSAADSKIPVKIDFYTGNPLLAVYPNQYLGSATVDNDGTAKLKFYQSPGQYAGGAIWVKTAQSKVYSNVVFYKVPPPKPELKLEVIAETPSADIISTNSAADTNVTYIARLSKADNKEPVYIDFYTGDPYSDCFPSKYLGTARADKNGVAQLKVSQSPGEYAGGAIWAQGDIAGINSNVVIYKVPPVKPQLKLEVFTLAGAEPASNSNSDGILPGRNVVYKVTLRPIQAGKVAFYTGSVNSRFPDKYLGSAELDRSGTAKFSFYQKPGKYAGGAIYIVTNDGKKIYSNVVLYEVKAIPAAEATNNVAAVKDELEAKAANNTATNLR